MRFEVFLKKYVLCRVDMRTKSAGEGRWWGQIR